MTGYNLLPAGLLVALGGVRLRASLRRQDGVLTSHYPMFSGDAAEGYERLIRFRLTDRAGNDTGFWQAHHLLPLEGYAAETAFRAVLAQENPARVVALLRFCLRELNEHAWRAFGERWAAPRAAAAPFVAVQLYYCGARMSEYRGATSGPYRRITAIARADLDTDIDRAS